MNIEDVLREMREKAAEPAGYGEQPITGDDVYRWADAIEAARRQPMADIQEVLREMRELIFDCDPDDIERWTDAIEAAMRDKDEELEFLRSVKESRGKELAERDAEIERLKAKVDALMLEFCPDEMTPEQMEQWGKNQKPTNAGKEDKL